MPERTRASTWNDPRETHERSAGLSGLEALRAWAAGAVPPPPMAQTLGITGIEVEEGQVTFTAEPAEFHCNPIGVVHGGLALTMLDSAMGCAGQTLLPAGAASTTLELKANFVRPLTLDTGPVRCTGTIVHPGRTVATAEGRIVDADGKLFAHGSSTLLITVV